MPGMHIQEPQYHNVFPIVVFPAPIVRFSAFSSHVFPSSWWAIQVFNFVFELRPKVGQALPVIKRVFPNAEAVAARVASRTSGIDAMKTWGWWIFTWKIPWKIWRNVVFQCHVNMFKNGVLICFNEVSRDIQGSTNMDDGWFFWHDSVLIKNSGFKVLMGQMDPNGVGFVSPSTGERGNRNMA